MNPTWEDTTPTWDETVPIVKAQKKKNLWDALEVPSQMSKQGLQMIAQSVSPEQQVTGNLPRDIAMNIPRITAETFAETAPDFISREAILTAGALKGLKLAAPAIKAVGRGVAKGAESISGLEYKTPGILSEVASKPSLLFAKGRKSANPAYEAAKKVGGKVRSSLIVPEKKQVVEKAYELAKSGKLNPTEAFEARKELSSIKNNVSGEFFRQATAKFNEIAKPIFSKGDEIYAKGIRAEELRRIFPVNKSGGTSIMKSTLGTLAGMVPAMAMSPIVQGTTAAAIGTGAKMIKPFVNNPMATATIGTALVNRKKKK